MTDWQPISTAPRDTQILLFVPANGFHIGEAWADHTSQGERVFFYDLEVGEIQPTHWMHLPPCPTE